ncbi:hypothetical protein D187_008736 [Cystobacter fuscus DSM 2262]|uniref:Phage tail protein n=1 Tax=Cystobacter fuscus (strain ATCC 25194 / DSM 2262 / NBRC 100088 / M29) TaxID=1242864 RepID=S9R0W5_CYSF2|nr:hypothetical protein [Cystobacter fuscus]EPX62548.1 hypothetical protein D187_008736 [Cystobacter fuscus DSM 2262]
MPTPEVIEAHLYSIHVLATKTEALSDANKPKTLKKFDIPDSMELRELKYLNNTKGLVQYSPGFRTMKGTLELDVVKDSPILTTIKTAYAARKPIWVVCVEDPDAATGAQGVRYEGVIGSYPLTLEAGTLVSVSIEFGINEFEPI